MLKRAIALLISTVLFVSAPLQYVRASDIQESGIENAIEESVQAVSEDEVITSNEDENPEEVPSEEAESSSDGNISWTLSSGVLTISGEGTISANTFSGNLEIQKLIISDGIEEIGESAFNGCENLVEVEIADTVTVVGRYTFEGCTELSKVKLSSNLTSLGYHAFKGCSSLKEIVIPATLTDTTKNGVYGYYGPFNGSGLETAVIEDGATKIADYLFYGATSLKKIEIPDSVTSVGKYALSQCTSLIEMSFSENVSTLGDFLLSGCTNLKSVIIPASITSMGDGVFQNCTLLSTAGPIGGGYDIEFGWTDALPNNAFRFCTGLVTLIVPEGVTSLGEYAVEYCQNLQSVYLPSTVKSIGYRAFRYDISLNSLVLPEGVESLASEAFYGCTGLMSITIPNSVTSIQNNTFSGCSNLIISCSEDSYALEYALKNDLLVNITNWEKAESDILLMDNCYYTTNSSDINSSGYIDLIVHYELNEGVINSLEDMKIRVLLPGKLVLWENSLRLDGGEVGEYTYDDNTLTVPVENTSGTLRFSVNPESATKLFTRAEFIYTLDGTETTEIIDCINSEVPVLTLNTNATVNSEKIQVSGIAPTSSEITFYIDDTEAGSTTASKAGNYSAELTLPEPEDGKDYRIKAVVTESSGTIEKEVTVTYDLSSPVLEELLMYYSGHETGHYENYVVDMTEPTAGKRIITFNPNMTYSFRVKMTNPELIDHLYVTSTRNGQVKYIEAIYDENTGYFITSDKFDGSNTNYVPGEIGVVFGPSYDYIDQETEGALSEAIIEETIDNYDFTDMSIEMKENDGENLCLDLSMPDGEKISYKYHEFTASELYSYLIELGLIDEATPVAMSDDETTALLNVLTEIFEDVTQNTGDHAVDYVSKVFMGETSEGDLLTIIFNEDNYNVFKTYCIESGSKKLISYVLEPDSMFIKLAEDDAEILDGISGVIYKAGKYSFTYLGRMWELDLQAMGATESEKAQIRETQELLTFVLVSRVALAFAKVSFSIAFPGAAIAIEIGYHLLDDLLETLGEEEDWVTAFDNSIIGKMIQNIKSAGLLVASLLQWIIDPSGYVYEAVTANRLSGVTTTVYYQDTDTGDEVLWDATEYDQVNPLITYNDGIYAWDVPEGMWKVKYEKDGYETAYSDWMEVPPPQTNVNIGLVSYEKPVAEWIDVNTESVQIEFSKYMIPETVNEVQLTDSDGAEITYELQYDTSETNEEGTVFAKTYTFVFDNTKLEYGEKCNIVIPDTVQSYAGVGTGDVSLTQVCSEKIEIVVDESVSVPYGREKHLLVTVSDENIENIDVASRFAELVQVENVEKTKTNEWDVTLAGKMVGTTEILISIPETNISKFVTVVVENTCKHSNLEVKNQKDATCTSEGYTGDSYCTSCGLLVEAGEVIEKLSHSWNNGKITTEATCTKDGVKTYTCTGCGETKTESISATGHAYEEAITPATMEKDGSVVERCKKCDDVRSEETIAAIDTVSLNKTKLVYSGKTQSVTVTVKDTDGKKVSSDYYTVTNTSKKSVGVYTVTVTFKGNYSGTEKIKYSIVPKKPSSLTAELYQYGNQVKITWTKSTGATGYRIYFKKPGGTTYTYLTSTTKLTYTKSGLTQNKKYTFKIVPYYKASGSTILYYGTGTGAYITKAITTATKGLKLATVTKPTVAKSGTKVKVSWKNISGETGYQISQSTSSTGTKIVSTYKTTTGKSKVISATKGKKYYYKVRAYRTVNGKKIYGAWSAVRAYTR